MKTQTINYPWFKKEDIDGFFALFQNNLANFVLIAVALIGMGFPASIVYGRIVPGAAVSVLFGNIYYAYMANRLAQKEGRTNVTALSYGISTPIMFVYLFGVMGPALAITGDPEIAWRIGMASCFFGGVVVLLGSIIGNWVRKTLPRAAMLGALAGVAFTFIGGELFFTTYEMPVVGLSVLAIIMAGLIAKKVMPFKIPTSLFAIVIGTVLAYTLREVQLSQIADGMDVVGFYPFLPTLGFIDGFKHLLGPMVALIGVLLPISIFNFIETMNNVEAMASAGDDYSVRECMRVDGCGIILGSLFGGVFPTTVYIASIGSKWMNAGRGYSLLNGFAFILASLFGIVAAISRIIPIPVIAPILVFVGISMISQAFSAVEKKHYPAVVIAMFPYFSNYLMTRFNFAAPDAVARVSSSIVPLGQGAMFTGIIWGAITVYIIDNNYKHATYVALVAAALAATGFIHAPRLSFFYDYKFTLGYVVMAGIFILFKVASKEESPMITSE
ncbi:MAG: NCS2 family permease [Alkaliphilus sp.]